MEKNVFWALLALFLFAFIYLKRYFFLRQLSFIPFPYLEIGMSYLFFRIMHLILDRAGGSIAEPIGFVPYFNYVCFFPSLVSGPIQLWQDRVKHAELTPLNESIASHAVSRMLTGYIKVFFVAEYLNRWYESNAVNFVKVLAASQPDAGALGSFAVWTQRSMVDHPYLLSVWVAGASTLFFVYLYLNFSGYMDIVIGVARLLGCVLPENFNRPFAAVSAIDFWTRWHITLSTWFKIYVFNPLLKVMMYRWDSPKAVPYLGCLAYFVTFLLLGVWHGRTIMFVALGLLLAAGVSVNKFYQVQAVRILGRKGYKCLAENRVYAALCRGMTFSYISISLVCMWMSPVDFMNVFGGHLVTLTCSAWLLLSAASMVVIQLRLMLSAWLKNTLRFFDARFEGFFVRNGWLALKLFFFSLVVIKITQPQSFVYQGF
jgi:D-alanyl-lipoteichoic acid acyltransferase DltB (MBOAT superfamily)